MLTNQTNYKMVVMDMDYTLLNKNKEVSPGNKEALAEAAKKGVHLVVATGRIYSSARFYTRLLGINTPIIASNGAIIKEDVTNKIMFQSILLDEVALEMIRLCKKKGLYCHLYSQDTVYTEKIINISRRYYDWNQKLNPEDRINIRVVDSIERTVEEEKGKILKAVVVDDDCEKLAYIRENIKKTGKVSVSQSLKDNLEVMNKGINKGNAIKILAEIYGIKRDEIIAIGDNENDISMIEYAGLGVAMGNGVEALKEKADYVTGNYDEDGVAQVIRKFVL
ncbi:Cof-type HAD-IIB family hydrolase [Lutispora thermophila]|nr:Cof-type HAD-IIB family hydrolase [Lutispora thermophila]